MSLLLFMCWQALYALLIVILTYKTAYAQLGCTQQTQVTLLSQFADNAAVGSIRPSSIRNIICTNAIAFNTGDLRSFSTAQYPNGVLRLTDGAGNAPPMMFQPDTRSICSADDTGQCVAASGGGFWLAQPNGSEDLREWGSPTSTTLAAAIHAIGSLSGGGGLLIAAPITLTAPVYGIAAGQTCPASAVCGTLTGNLTLQGVSPRGTAVTCSWTTLGWCLGFLGTSTATQMYGVNLKNLHFVGSGLTSGGSLDLRFVAQMTISDVVSDTVYSCAQWSGTNDVTFRDFYCISNGGIPMKWFSEDASALERSDVTNFDQVTITEHTSGSADCLVLQDNVNTLNTSNNVNLLNCDHGLYATTTNASASTNRPSFLQLGPGFAVDSAAKQALYFDSYAQQVYCTQCQLTVVGAGTVPAVQTDANVDVINISMSRILGRNYGIINAAVHAAFIGNDYNSSTTGNLNNTSSVAASFLGGTAFNGNPIAVSGTLGTTAGVCAASATC